MNAIYYVSYKLKKDVDVAEFLDVSKKLNDGYISKQKGYISWKQLNHGETWADMLIFESMEDLQNFQNNSNNPDELALKFYSFINLPSCKFHPYTVEVDHK
ncbi:MAG: hypothetical protein FWE45_02485 [Firmicutes bacterium]|nr:hypothetical protein [Bacillota bacterium]